MTSCAVSGSRSRMLLIGPNPSRYAHAALCFMTPSRLSRDPVSLHHVIPKSVPARALRTGRAAAERVLVDPEPANARFQRGGRNVKRLRRALDAVHPAAAGRQRSFDLLAVVVRTVRF